MVHGVDAREAHGEIVGYVVATQLLVPDQLLGEVGEELITDRASYELCIEQPSLNLAEPVRKRAAVPAKVGFVGNEASPDGLYGATEISPSPLESAKRPRSHMTTALPAPLDSRCT